MKIKNMPDQPNTTTVKIWRGGKPLTLTVAPLPINFRDRLAQAIPMPEARIEFARENGKVLRDLSGDPVKVVRDDDPAHRAARRRVDGLQALVMARHALRLDEAIEWDTPEPTQPWGDRQYAERIEAEFAAAGFSDGEIDAILRAERDLEKGLAERVEAREKNSSSATETGG